MVMEKKDLKIELRATRDFTNEHVLQFRICPDQDLSYRVEYKWFWGLVRFGLKKKYDTDWHTPLYFYGLFPGKDYYNALNWSTIFVSSQDELKKFQEDLKTYGDLSCYLYRLGEKHKKSWLEERNDWY